MLIKEVILPENGVELRGYIWDVGTDALRIHPSMVLRCRSHGVWTVAISQNLGEYEEAKLQLALYNAMMAKAHFMDEYGLPTEPTKDLA